MQPNTEAIIDDLINVTFGDRTAREQFLFRQSLHNLVRMARAEQLLEIRASVATLTGAVHAASNGHKANIDGL